MAKKGRKKDAVKLKPYEIAKNVIDLDAYIEHKVSKLTLTFEESNDFDLFFPSNNSVDFGILLDSRDNQWDIDPDDYGE